MRPERPRSRRSAPRTPSAARSAPAPTALKCRRGSGPWSGACHVNVSLSSSGLPVFSCDSSLAMVGGYSRRTRARLRLLAPRCLGRRSVGAVSVSADSEVRLLCCGPASSCAGTASGWLGGRASAAGAGAGSFAWRCSSRRRGRRRSCGAMPRGGLPGLERRCDGTGDRPEDVFDGGRRGVRSPGSARCVQHATFHDQRRRGAAKSRSALATALTSRGRRRWRSADEQRLEPCVVGLGDALRTRCS